METLKKTINNIGLIPLAKFSSEEKALKTVKALNDGGIGIIGVEIRDPNDISIINLIRATYPEIIVGAYQVTNIEAAVKAIEAGAHFIINTDFEVEIVQWCINNNILIFPGGVTANEIKRLVNYNLSTAHYFPVSIYGGAVGCSFINSAYPKVDFIVSGGVEFETLIEYVDKKHIFAISGEWICSKNNIANNYYDNICKMAVKSVNALLGIQLEHANKVLDNGEIKVNNIERTIYYMSKFEYIHMGDGILQHEANGHRIHLVEKPHLH